MECHPSRRKEEETEEVITQKLLLGMELTLKKLYFV
jgi:hypothetical protein